MNTLDVLFYSRDISQVIAKVRERVGEWDDSPESENAGKLGRILRAVRDDGGAITAWRWAARAQAPAMTHPTNPAHSLKMIRFDRETALRMWRAGLDEITIGQTPILRALAAAPPEEGGPIEALLKSNRSAMKAVYREFWPEQRQAQTMEGDLVTIDQSYPDGAFRFAEFAGDARLRRARQAAEGAP